jgi:hypothetical protein
MTIFGPFIIITKPDQKVMMKRFVVGLSLLFSVPVFAQVQDPTSPGYDPMAAPTTDSMSANQYLAEQQGGDGDITAEVVAKPYERLVLNFDSATNLITYTGIVEQPESSSDSLYLRAKKWAAKSFGANSKALYEVDKKNQKVIINGYIPAYAYGNKYSKRLIGKFQFKMTVWFKEERYKYNITNLVHEGIKPNEGEAVRNYFEYYYTTTTNVRGYDQVLRFADKDLNKMLDEFKKAMKDPLQVDEDEW